MDWARAIAGCALAGLSVSAQQGDRAGEEQPDLPPELTSPAAPPLSAREQLETFDVAPGLVVELVASEPLVVDPVAISFDEAGRMWVVEMRGYMPNIDGTDEDAPNGVIAVLSDSDGDGRMDRRVEFAKDLVLPRAVARARGGALIIAPPDLLFCEDLDEDGVMDRTTVVDTGLGGIASPEHAINGLVYTHDNWYRCSNQAIRYRFVEGLFGDGEWESGRTAGGGQWGITKDDLGRIFYNTNSDPLRGDLYASHYAIRNSHHGRAKGVNVRLAHDFSTWPARPTPGVNRGYRDEALRADFTLAKFTGACGPVIYRGDALPAEYHGNAFVCEPTGNLIKRYVMEQDGFKLTARNAWDGREVLTSTDERFRPVNMATGPDGALYIVDLYRGILQHRIFMTSFLRKQILQRGLQEPVGLGRIWRVRREGWSAPQPLDASESSWEELVALLDHANGFWRDTAQRLIVEEGRGEERLLPLLRESARSASSLGRIHALWALAGLDELDVPTLLSALRADPDVANCAVRLAEPWFAREEGLMQRAAELASSTDDRLRLQLVLSLGAVRTVAAEQIMSSVLEADCSEPVLRGAALSGLHDREAGFLARILSDSNWSEKRAGRAELVRALARAIARAGSAAACENLIQAALERDAQRTWQRVAVFEGLLAGRDKGPTGDHLPLTLAREPRFLPKLRAGESESAQQLLANLTWPGDPNRAEANRVRPLTELEQYDFEDGARLYVQTCAQCHQASGLGDPGKAPALRQSDWVLGSDERLVRILLHGMNGPLEMNGVKWNLDMPAFAAGDEDVAAVLTYLRRAWGHGADPIAPERVEEIRVAERGRKKPWTAAELRSLASQN